MNQEKELPLWQKMDKGIVGLEAIGGRSRDLYMKNKG